MSFLVIPNVLVNGTPGDAVPVNANFTAIAAILNGALDQSNLSPGTQFPTSSIAQDGGFQTGHLANGAVTAAKLAPGASVRNRFPANVVQNLGFTTVETTLLSLGPMTTSGGRVLIVVAWGLSCQIGTGASGTITLRLKRNGTTIVTVAPHLSNSTAANIEVAMHSPQYADMPTAGTYTYTITGQTSAGNLILATPATDAGTGYMEEAA
jgi:hypothetical protein